MVTSFEGKYRFLSNFYECGIRYEGRTFYNVEAAYQSAKKDDPKYKDRLSSTVDPVIAKKIGRNQQGRDWPTKSLDIMLELLRLKFNEPTLKQKLLDTKSEVLIEGNWWGDTFWGQCPLGTGENHLGILLMQVRKELREEFSS